MNDNYLTLNEVAGILGKSKRTIGRYVARGLLTPEKIKNENGILENRFNPKEVNNFRLPERKKAPGTQRPEPGHIGQKTNVIDTTDVIGLLKNELKTKDKEIARLHKKIDKLIDRQRETNILIGTLQSKVLAIEHKPEGHNEPDTGQKGNGIGRKVSNFINRVFGK